MFRPNSHYLNILRKITSRPFVSYRLSGSLTGRNMGLTYRVANKDESSTIKKFLIEHYLPNLGIFVCLGISPYSEEVGEFLDESLSAGLSQQTTVVATNENGEIVGLSLNHLVEDTPDFREEETSAPVPNGVSPQKVLEIFITKLHNGYGTLIPKESQKVLLISMLSVNKNYGKQGIGRMLLQASADNAKKHGFDAAIAYSVSKASQILFGKVGYTVLRVIKHKDFVNEEGRQLIECDDGTEEGQLVFSKL